MLPAWPASAGRPRTWVLVMLMAWWAGHMLSSSWLLYKAEAADA